VLEVVAPDQGEGHRQVGEGVGGQQQGEAAQGEFVDAQGAGEPLDDHPPVRRHVDLADLPAQAVVDEALGQLQEEVSFHRGAGALDVEAVAEDAVEDGLADLAVVVGLGRDVQRPGAEVLAAAAAGLVLGVVDVEPGFLTVGQGADTTVKVPLAVAGLATVRAGVTLGGAAHGAGLRQEHGLCPSGKRR
jgi:hypothetical protein